MRVSKQEQHEALQIDALKEAGCEKWFVDKMTGSKAQRKGLDGASIARFKNGKIVFMREYAMTAERYMWEG